MIARFLAYAVVVMPAFAVGLVFYCLIARALLPTTAVGHWIIVSCSAVLATAVVVGTGLGALVLHLYRADRRRPGGVSPVLGNRYPTYVPRADRIREELSLATTEVARRTWRAYARCIAGTRATASGSYCGRP